jgi:hypothetical protein
VPTYSLSGLGFEPLISKSSFEGICGAHCFLGGLGLELLISKSSFEGHMQCSLFPRRAGLGTADH